MHRKSYSGNYLVFVCFCSLMSSLLFTGCSEEIGDSCTTNIDCSTQGDRICDTSMTGGYCTVEGCDADSCPEEAACIRFFPAPFLSRTCDPKTEDSVDPSIKATNDCDKDDLCLSSGFCAMRSLERRFCMKRCESTDDCRENYECRATGTFGAEPLLRFDGTGEQTVHFCAARNQ